MSWSLSKAIVATCACVLLAGGCGGGGDTPAAEPPSAAAPPAGPTPVPPAEIPPAPPVTPAPPPVTPAPPVDPAPAPPVTPPPAAATPLPSALAITTVSAEVGVDQPLSSTLGTPAPGLQTSWEFGDGSPANSAAAPSHRWAQVGDYTVRLTVSNESGQRLVAEQSVAVRRMAWVSGMVCGGAQQSGWCTGPLPFGADVEDPQFFGAGTAFRRSAASWAGSDDAGRRFTPRVPAADAKVIDVHAPDAQNAWMVWKDAEDVRRLSRTRDGGRTWSALRTLPAPPGRLLEYGLIGSGERLLLVQTDACTERWFSCLSRNNALSLDGGVTWTSLPDSVNFKVTAVGLTPSGSVTWVDCLSTNGGFCWYRSTFNVYTVENGVRSVPYGSNSSVGPSARRGDTLLQLTAVSQGFSVGPDLLLWRSNDGGRNWTTTVTSVNQIGGSLPIATQSWLDIRQQRCGTNVCELLELGQFGSATYYTSTNGGATWTPSPVPPHQRIDALGDILLDTSGARVSVDGGSTWRPLPASSAPSSSDTLLVTATGALWFIDRFAESARHYQSTDGGQTWSLAWVRNPQVNNGIRSAWVFADGRAVAASSSGLQGSDNRDYLWTPLGSGPAQSRRMAFFDANSGFSSGADPGSAAPQVVEFHRSYDGGRSWVAQTLPSAGRASLTIARDLQALPDGTLWLAGSEQTGDAVWRLPVGASQWERMGSAPQARSGGSLQFTSATQGYLLSVGGLHGTDDAGRTWQAVPFPTGPGIRALYFADDRVGWLAGDGGRILHTRDGGTTWTPQVSGTTSDIHLVGALDPYTVWVNTVDASGNPAFLFSATGGR